MAAIMAMFVAIPENAAAVQVSGQATLVDAADHSGTTVLFVADSPGAVTDSTLTDANGDYLLDIASGAYDVEFRHPDYVPQSQLNQLITAETVLANVELLPTSRILSGALSGILEAGKSYFVEGEINVQAADTLTIQPGAKVYFNGDYSLTVNGLLMAVGAEGDPVQFLSGQEIPAAEDWGGIVFALNSDDNSRLEYCDILYGSWAVMLHLTSTTISHCTIRNAKHGIYLFPDSRPDSVYPVIEDCVIENIQDPGISIGLGIYAATVSRTTFRSCGRALEIYGSPDGDSSQVTDCIIEDCGDYAIYCASTFFGTISGTTISGSTIGIYIRDGSPVIQRCIIVNNSGSGIYMKSSSPNISQCDISGSSSGLAFTTTDIEATIENNIIHANSALGTNSTNSANSHIFYNCLVSNYTTNYPPNLGVPVMVNANGDSCDIYYNISLDPEWTDPDNLDFTLLSTSPCIDAGDPGAPQDPDGTVTDMGAIYFDQPVSSVPHTERIRGLSVAQNHPNPFNPSTVISFDVEATTHVHVTIYDVAGHIVRELVQGERMDAGPHAVTWDGKDRAGRSVTSGVYFYRVQTDTEHQVKSMTLLK